MKRCPACNRVESDDVLGFCRADGSPLVNDSGAVRLLKQMDNSSLITNATISHNRIIKKIGAGGMGKVYLARDTDLDPWAGDKTPAVANERFGILDETLNTQ